jgi:hypothetical protein
MSCAKKKAAAHPWGQGLSGKKLAISPEGWDDGDKL